MTRIGVQAMAMMPRPVALPLFLMLAAASARADVQGRVLSPEGKPVAGATVTALAPESADARAKRLMAGQERLALATAKAGPDGSFRLASIEPVVAVGIRADGYAPAFATGLQGEPLTVTLKAGATRRGTVRAGGKPVADAALVWTGAAGGGDIVEMVARSAKDGSYDVPDPNRWAAALVILHRDFAPSTLSRDPTWEATLRHDLQPGIRIQGRVVEDGTSRGVAGAHLWVDGWPLAESGPDGGFTIAHAAPDSTNVAVRSATMAGLGKIGASPLLIAVKPARRLTGIVRDSKTKQPLPGARVTAVALGPGGAGNAGDVTTTDARGQYQLTALAAGRYWVSTTRPGYQAGYAGGDDDAVDLRKTANARRDIEITPLRRVSGRVQDEHGRPKEGALVMLGVRGLGTFYGNTGILSGMRGGHLSFAEAPVRTASDGTFALTVPGDEEREFGGLPPQIVALAQGYAAGTAQLPAGRPAPVVITLPRGVTLAGRVRAADGAPVAGAGIAVGETGPLMSMSSLGSEEQESTDWAKTEADGRFAVQVHPVLHQLLIRKPGFAPRRLEGVDPRSDEALDVVLDRGARIQGQVVRHDGRGVAEANISVQDAATTVVGTTTSGANGAFHLGELVPGPYELTVVAPFSGLNVKQSVEAPSLDLRIELAPTATVRGRVSDAASHLPVPRFNTSFRGAEEFPEGDFSGRTEQHTSADGTFVLEDVPIGRATLIVNAEGYRTREIEGLAISADAGAPEIEVAMDPGVTVRGRVTSTDGTAVADASVSAESDGDHQGSQTDENGDYEIAAVAPGEVELEYRKTGFRMARRTLQVLQPSRVDVTLSRGLSLRGTVTADGVGVAKAQVHASSSVNDTEPQYVITDEAGRFTLQGLVPGRYEVSAAEPHHGKGELHDVDVETAGSLRLVLERAPTAVLTGTVVGLAESAGARPPVVMVQVQSEDGEGGQYGVADVSGAFRIEDAPAGRIMVLGQAMSADGGTRSSLARELILVAGSETATVVEFRDELVVSGTVLRAGLGLPGASVTFRDSGPASSASKTDGNGHYEVNLAPGTYSVDVSGVSGVSHQTQYVAVESATFDIDVTGAALIGRVVEAGTDTPVPGVDISLWPVGGSESSPANTMQSSAQGTFEVASLREGHYRLLTAKKGFGQQVREVELQRGAAAEILLELQPADGVSVKVVDARDNRTLEAIVVVRDLARRIVANKHSGDADKDGTVTVALADGRYLLSVSATGYGTITAPITAPTRGLRIGLTPGGTLVIESPRNLRGRIRLVQPDGEDYVSCWCNGIAEILLEGRRTTVEHITPGRYKVVLVDAPESPPRPVEITEGAVSTLAIE